MQGKWAEQSNLKTPPLQFHRFMHDRKGGGIIIDTFGRSLIICFNSSSKFASNILSASSIMRHCQRNQKCKSKTIAKIYTNICIHASTILKSH